MKNVARCVALTVVGLVLGCGRGSVSSGTAGTAGGAADRGGTTGTAGSMGTAGTTGSAGSTGTAGTTGSAGTTGAAGSAGRGGTGGGGGDLCGGQICGANEFCCGPPACGSCRNILTGPNCPTSCGGAGGNAGTGNGGQGGTDCTTTPCPAGQVCFSRVAGALIVSVECVDDPCAPAPLACSCAASTLDGCNQLCTVTGRNITCGTRCAAPDTAIATPSGEQPIATLRPGDLVFSMHRGRLVAVPIVRTTRTPAVRHHVVRVTLETGRVLLISPGHPTAGGGTFGELRVGARLGERRVVAAEIVPYPHPFTYDILPGSDSGTYLAAGALVGSTLAPPAAPSENDGR
jgi:hypothetical protein